MANVKVVRHEKHSDSFRGRLVFETMGFSTRLVNSVLRMASSRVPSYAFPMELVAIADTPDGYSRPAAFNNDYIRMRASQIPPFGLDPGIFELDPKYWDGVDYLDASRPTHDSERDVCVIVDSSNDTSENTFVTTNDMTVLVDGKRSDIFKGFPMKALLIVLKPKEALQCSLKGVLGVGERHSIWSSASNYFFETNGDSMVVTIESGSRIGEVELVKRATLNLESALLKRRGAPNGGDAKTASFIVSGEDISVAALVSSRLREDPKVTFSSHRKSGAFAKDVEIIAKGDDVAKAALRAIDSLIVTVKSFRESFLASVDGSETII